MRLTVLYGSVFFLAGGLIVVAMYVLVTVALQNQPAIEVRPFNEGPVSRPLPETMVPGPAERAAREASPAHPSDTLIQRSIQSADDTRRSATLKGLLHQSLIALGLIGVAAIAIGHQLAGRALRPLTEITETARRVAGRNLHERIGLTGPADEIKDLADTFDQMLERLDASFAGQRDFVANASHELRTPLTIERTLVEVALADPDSSADARRLGESLLAVNTRSERLIDALLTLARSEQKLVRRVPINLAEIVESARKDVAGEGQGIRFEIDISVPHVNVEGDPDLVGQAVLNLMQNAVRYNVPGGVVTVTVHSDVDSVRLDMSNTGPPITLDQARRMFEPFVRLDSSRTGQNHGLGLSIVRSVAISHGGTVVAVPRTGGGITVSLVLPKTPTVSGDTGTRPQCGPA